MAVMCAGLLISSAYASLQTNISIPSTGTIQQLVPNKYAYIMKVSGQNYQMLNGATNQVLFQSTSSSKVFNNIVGNCSAGSSIDILSGTYLVDSTWLIINIDNINLHFEQGAKLVAADGINTSILQLSNSNGCIINGATIDGNAANNPSILGSPAAIEIQGSNDMVVGATIYNVRVFGVSITPWARGVTVKPVNSGVINSTIYNCGANAVQLSGYSGNYAINNNLYGCSDVGVSTYEANSTIAYNYIHDLNGTSGIGGNAKYGIAIEGDSFSYGCSAIINNNVIVNTSNGIVINTWGYPQPYDYNNISNNTIINSKLVGIEIGSSYNVISQNSIVGIGHSGASYDAFGILLEYNGSFNIISDNYISQSDCYGVYLRPGSVNNTLFNNKIFDNGMVNVGDKDQQSGIFVASNYNMIKNNSIYDDRTGTSRTQLIGIAMPSWAPCMGNIIEGNSFFNNVLYSIYDLNIPQNTFINNTGYNPVGQIVNPIAGSTAYLVDSGTSSTWKSGQIYTNSGSAKQFNITGGVISTITKNGVVIFTTTNCIVTLQPYDTISITFSAIPTINVTGK